MTVARPTRTRKPAKPAKKGTKTKKSPKSRPLAPKAVTAHRRELLEAMLRIRRFEERCVELYSATKIRGFVHLYIGEEAVAVGVNEALTPEDAVVSTYREHGHALARGITAEAVMAEMYGRTSGCSGGRGGSMHLFDVSRRFYGGNAIVAGGLPLAAGLALADRMRGQKRVTCCFFGDGAFAEGEFHETANLAALWNLPLLLVCENNLYAMGTALERHQAQTDLALRAASYGMVAWSVDGMDVEAVERAARRAVEGIRTGTGPHFLELRTYRFRAHSMYDPDRYRDKAEVERWKSRDPIGLLVDRMRESGDPVDKDVARIERRIATEIDDAVEAAEQAPEEPVETLLRHVTTASSEAVT
ncbi:pyruvate dehydrogenase (acetyl-transferring) E1 component subunit alpha [Streptomyces scabiei]|uniref:pyruvate dehydrogenase (acetyl-transferring) E1 component subunit alpha n=1 Tax=Streptomyces scabiei TaxID=1930 RepID=UPI00299021AC|nr:pyruvate dehydrogenase (acetyl-transferring) E1 component subunit alpha [Streptomyces scabiei]MDW8805523.1 pyruvate dehydrogenase (acetyl-transferring) E1 component subunit alpha [Streptomyces scabiei]